MGIHQNPRGSGRSPRILAVISEEYIEILDAIRGNKSRSEWIRIALKDAIDRITIEICPRCKGDGDEWDEKEGIFVECPLCGGAERVRKVKGKVSFLT